MCERPNNLPDGTATACHECWQCRERAINDWVGRCIAESKTAGAAYAITLTYGRDKLGDSDHPSAVLLTYSDVQRWLKLLRRHCGEVRYFVTGEFGSKKGRAHWHVILFFRNKKRVPWHLRAKNFMHARLNADGSQAIDNKTGKPVFYWPHGWSYWTSLDSDAVAAVRYNCKYVLKDMGDEKRQGHLSMSKKPPLGTAFFRKRAEDHVAQRISPKNLHYSFREVTKPDAEGVRRPIQFMLKDRPAEMYLEHFMETWEKVNGNKQWPKSQLIEEYLDGHKRKRRHIMEALAQFQGDLSDVEKFARQVLIDDLDFLDIQKEKDDIAATGEFKLKPGPMPRMDDNDWWYAYIRSAPDGEERQRREEEFEWYQHVQFDKWRDRVWEQGPERWAFLRFELDVPYEVWGAARRSRKSGQSGPLRGAQPDKGWCSCKHCEQRRREQSAAGGNPPGGGPSEPQPAE